MNSNSHYLIAIEQSAEVEELLVREGVNLVRALQDEGLDVERSDEALPATNPEFQAKEATLIILASAAAAAVLAETVRRILRDRLHRPHLVQHEELRPVLDGNGAPVKDMFGQPYLDRVVVHELLQPAPTGTSESLSLPGILRMTTKTEPVK